MADSVRVNELDSCLAQFEAELAAQQARPETPSPLAGKVAIGVEQALMAKFLDADLGKYYGGGAADQIVYQLRAQMFRMRHLPGGHRLARCVAPDVGIALTATVLGVPWSRSVDKEPWARGQPPVRSAADLADRPLPDFATAGMMPIALQTHRDMRKLLGPSYGVAFPLWDRGPLGNAFYLAGAELALMSMYEDRGLYHRLMRFGMGAMKKWLTERAAFMGEPIPSEAWIWNDEVSAENFPASLYAELVAPYDKEYADFFGGRASFHSCGNTTPLMSEIASVCKWQAFHVSAWSDLDAALTAFPDTPLYVSLHPYREVLGCPLHQTRRRIREIVRKCRSRQFVLCVGELMPVKTPDQDLQRIRDVWAICEDAFA